MARHRSPDGIHRTREEALRDLRELQDEEGDIELQHSQADEILLELLITLGYGDVVVEWEKVPKWYA